MISSSIHQYTDVKAVLDAAIAAGGGRYTLKTKGAAVHWRARAYAYRKLLQRLDEDRQIVPGLSPSSPYDGMMLTIADDDPCTVIIHTRKVVGVLTDNEGRPIEIAKQKESEADEFQRAAEELAAKLTLD